MNTVDTVDASIDIVLAVLRRHVPGEVYEKDDSGETSWTECSCGDKVPVALQPDHVTADLFASLAAANMAILHWEEVAAMSSEVVDELQAAGALRLAPRVFRDGDPMPTDVTAVMAHDRSVWIKGETNNYWFCGNLPTEWDNLVSYRPLVEVTLPKVVAE